VSAGYRYTRLGRHYLCLDQSAIRFAWIVLWSDRVFVQRLLGLSIEGLVKAAVLLLADRLGLKSADVTIELVHPGQIALCVNGGVRVFDFRTGEVTKVFDRQCDTTQRRAEVEAVERASACGVAPRLVRVEADGAWYTEALWPGRQVALPRPGFATGAEHAFLGAEVQRLAEALAQLALAAEPERVPAERHLAQLMQGVSDWLARASEQDRNSAAVVERFVRDVVEQLDCPDALFLTFSHGDFSLLNVITDGRDWKVIDWEDAERRTALTDFYSLFTTELYYGRETQEVAEWAQTGLEALLRVVERGNRVLARDLRQSPACYRAWAHLERLRMLMSRGADEKRVGVVRRAAEVFERFDRAWPVAA
jgi:thiamine kinase-like enzyme